QFLARIVFDDGSTVDFPSFVTVFDNMVLQFDPPSPCLLGPCDDADPCTTDDFCAGDVCAGSPIDCDDRNPCTDDRCDVTGGDFRCVHTNNMSCVGPECGNGNIDPHETCDPPNLTPDPITGEVRCRLDCTSCGDGVQQIDDGEVCDDGNTLSGCDPVHRQKPLDNCQNNCTRPVCADPTRIHFGPGLDRLDFHGRLILAAGETLGQAQDNFVIELTGGEDV